MNKITDWTKPIRTTCGRPFIYNENGYGSTKEHQGPRAGEMMHYGWVADDTGRKDGNWYYDSDGTPARPSTRYVLEMVQPKLDPTKPLEYVSPDGERGPAPLIGVLETGQLIVGNSGQRGRPGSAVTWAIFSDEGAFVRSQDNTGGGLRLANKAQMTSEYIAITKSGTPVVGIAPYRNRQLAWDMNPDADHLVQIDKLDGVVTGVGVLKRKS